MDTSGASSASPSGPSSRRKLTTAAVAGLVLVVAAGIWTRLGDSAPAMPAERDLPVILKEAAGTAPLPAKDTPGRKALRDSFRYLLDEDKAYHEELEARFRTPAMLNLLKPLSFAHAPTIEQLIAELRELKEVETEHVEAVDRFPEVAKQNMEKAGVAAPDVQAFQRALERDHAQTAVMLADAVETELEWIDAVIALYQFALDHEGAIHVNNDLVLEFEDEVTQTEFDRLAAKVDELGKLSEEANAVFDAGQQKAQRKTGITRRDLAR